MEDDQVEKVYIAVGNDLQDGFKTLDWTLRKWSSSPMNTISIVILHVSYNIFKDFVYTPFGKLPASSVSDEKLQVLRRYEEEKTDKLLSKYIAFCGKVKAEILKVEKYDEPIHKLMLDLISGLRITKLVMGITFMKSTTWKSKSAISGLFYIHQNKPDFCEFFILCGGKLVFLNEGIVEDDEGTTLAKMRDKANFRTWLARVFTDNSLGRNSGPLSPSSKDLHSPDSLKDQWQSQEIENYFQHLLSLNLDQENFELEDDHDLQTTTSPNPIEPDLPENSDSNMSVAEKTEYLRSKLSEAREMIQLRRKEDKAHAEGYTKAEWAICLSNTRAEKFEILIKEEIRSRIEAQNSLDSEKEQLHELIRDLEDRQSRLNSLAQLQSELSNELQQSTMAKRHAEAELEKSVITRADMVKEIEEFRRQRDVLNRRIDFCKEKDAIGLVARSIELISCGHREYTAEDIRLATDDFSQRLRLKSGGDWTNVYRGRLHYATVAVKLLHPVHGHFQSKVRLLSDIRHPHLVAMMGFCSELKCIVLEYMHTGNLRDILFTSPRSYRKYNRALRWPDRIRIANEVCSGLSFMHSAEPSPLVHGHLVPSNILLDRNLVAKISGFGLDRTHDQSDVRLDIRAFGVVLLNLLTGRNWAGLVEEAMSLDRAALVGVLDEKAGKWPLDLAEELAEIAMKCLSVNQEPNSDLRIANIIAELEMLKKKADDIKIDRGDGEVVSDRGANEEEGSSDVPSVFLCPIFQEVMKNPHVAADGFSYEVEAIEEWLGMGHDTSPMTNLRLKHKLLTPNHTLRSLILDWHSKRSNLPS
ncbi:hypothetical protein Ddye_009646 [Dipteronia dyeriana]|uniref:RING-type E3 ubiquitin transferase n=1 Tax=Dipteronia dyeriana TaxID=168575 RepID=A0AAD9XBX3_9ROSI|nr:hypothetical protein Ddye_009646 [Dipteronia dyeriana]